MRQKNFSGLETEAIGEIKITRITLKQKAMANSTWAFIGVANKLEIIRSLR